jgi:hypothetical protein
MRETAASLVLIVTASVGWAGPLSQHNILIVIPFDE